MANFGMVGVDWQERINFDRLRKYRLNRARQMMKEYGLHWHDGLQPHRVENTRRRRAQGDFPWNLGVLWGDEAGVPNVSTPEARAKGQSVSL